ncbi:MAG: hypothetical protein U9N33_03955 [Campylobacterota bacterium]|nr:hypothetical protein [Campylobacterota bacterium]
MGIGITSIFIATVCFAEDSFAEHEAKMQQMRNSMSTQGTYNDSSSGLGKQERKRLQDGSGGGEGNGQKNGSGSGQGKGRSR